MKNTKHTPTPWRVLNRRGVICHVNGNTDIFNWPGKTEANARRIVACVNACDGIDDPSVVAEMVKFLRLLPWENLSGFREDQIARMGAILKKIGGHQEKESKK